MGSCHIDLSYSTLDAASDYSNIKMLKKLYKNFYNLESEAVRGNQLAMAIYTDLNASLEMSKRIITIKQKFCISAVLINAYTIEETAEMMKLSATTVQSHIDGGLKRISKALVNGEVYNNKYEVIASKYGTIPNKQLAEELNISVNTLKSIWRRIKSGEDK